LAKLANGQIASTSRMSPATIIAEPCVLPPEFTLDDFTRFISRAGQLIGPGNIEIVTALHGKEYLHQPKSHDLFHIYEKERFIASAIVTPRHVPDVQAIVELCNEFVMPVWPISIGRNVGYGGASPRVPGSLIMDLGVHMNRIVEVNVDGAYALVEPGVTFMQLHEYLEKNDLKKHLWLSVRCSCSLPFVTWISFN
jgi:FAD/FMN-containing dehydrogenase